MPRDELDNIPSMNSNRWRMILLCLPAAVKTDLYKAVAESLWMQQLDILRMLVHRVQRLPLEDPPCTLQGRMQAQTREKVCLLLTLLIQGVEEDGPVDVSVELGESDDK